MAQDGDLFPEIGIILSGSLHLEHVDSNGNNNLLYVLNPGDAVGELNAVGRYRLHVSISTEEPTEILYLSVDQLLRKNLLTAPTPDPLFAEPDPGRGPERPVPDPQAGGQRPPHHAGQGAGLSVRPVP